MFQRIGVCLAYATFMLAYIIKYLGPYWLVGRYSSINYMGINTIGVWDNCISASKTCYLFKRITSLRAYLHCGCWLLISGDYIWSISSSKCHGVRDSDEVVCQGTSSLLESPTHVLFHSLRSTTTRPGCVMFQYSLSGVETDVFSTTVSVQVSNLSPKHFTVKFESFMFLWQLHGRTGFQLDLVGHVPLPNTAIYSPHNVQQLKGNSHQILLSEMSLPGVEVLIEKLLPGILGRLGKENPSERRCKVAFVQRKCAVTSSVSVQFLYASYN